MAREGPKAANPSTYIRFIYNRINLERAVIRAAAVSALAAFANGVASLKKSILHLLKKCLDDSDDEVRERAYFYIVMIEQDMKNTVLDDNLSVCSKEEQMSDQDMADVRNFIFDIDTNIDVNALEDYINTNKAQILEQEEEINIDLKPMMVKGNPNTQRSTNASTSSNPSSSSNQQQ